MSKQESLTSNKAHRSPEGRPQAVTPNLRLPEVTQAQVPPVSSEGLPWASATLSLSLFPVPLLLPLLLSFGFLAAPTYF